MSSASNIEQKMKWLIDNKALWINMHLSQESLDKIANKMLKDGLYSPKTDMRDISVINIINKTKRRYRL